MSRGKKAWAALSSPIGRKVLTGITVLGLTLFVILHMIGNLSYFSGGGEYNLYADFLLSTGPLLILLEIVLLVAVVLHAIIGLQIRWERRRARGGSYRVYKSNGRPSYQSLSSRSMALTGVVLGVFLVIHLLSFKFGPSIDDGYIATAEDGVTYEAAEELGPDDVEQVGDVVVIRDLRRLVTHKFNNPLYAFGYVAVMLILALHLRHGIWSALQSLGAMSPKLTPLVYTIGGLLAIAIAVGFFVLPLYIFFFVPDPGAPAAAGAVLAAP